MEKRIKTLCDEILEYAESKELSSTKKALDFICQKIYDKNVPADVKNNLLQELLHCLEVSAMLIELHINIEDEQEDILLSAVLLHIYPEIFSIEDLKQNLIEKHGFSHSIYELIDTISQRNIAFESEQQKYYERIQCNKLALLAALADRGNVVQNLYKYSSWNAHKIIDETKICYYPMCIYAKEHYYDLLAPISILKEKIKSLVDMQEILLKRYEIREAELVSDILALREENATIKGIIANLKSHS